ncbi:dienelactone hydrolase family protein [Streptomyces thinghirensis]|uniref:Dienelactone hydrolase family protein n=1 Tax=Streptomyces thinghirensis TaxID=551547 RepID=A0ABP9T4G2_9ACTN
MELAFPRIDPAVSEVMSARGALRVAEIRLGGVPRGAVIVLCDAGTGGQDAPGVMNALVEHGYESVAAVLPASGAGSAATDHDLLEDVAALLGRLAERGWSPDQVGLVGYGLGGRTALLAAAEFPLGAAVSVAPAGLTAASGMLPALADAARPVRTPWLGLFGEEDADAPAPAVLSLGASLAQSSAYTELVTYPGVARAFHDDAARDALAHAAAFDSWQRTVEWFDLRVVPRPTPLAQAWQERAAGTVQVAPSGA